MHYHYCGGGGGGGVVSEPDPRKLEKEGLAHRTRGGARFCCCLGLGALSCPPGGLVLGLFMDSPA